MVAGPWWEGGRRCLPSVSRKQHYLTAPVKPRPGHGGGHSETLQIWTFSALFRDFTDIQDSVLDWLLQGLLLLLFENFHWKLFQRCWSSSVSSGWWGWCPWCLWCPAATTLATSATPLRRGREGSGPLSRWGTPQKMRRKTKISKKKERWRWGKEDMGLLWQVPWVETLWHCVKDIKSKESL